MGQIRVLSPTLVSRIAAGECIERPASVVKELVENALDAGAGRIDIAIAEGGRDLIHVSDDGCGMDADDLELCVTQHATSKIAADEDLSSIHTLGFRGEALASIGSVARLRIVSRRAGSDVAHEILVEGGAITGPRPCNAPPGTSIEVRDLFYAVPARRKFLRTNQTETGHITEQLARVALAHPGIAFNLRSGKRVTHRLAATGDRRQRISDFYGPELASALLPIERESGSVRIAGLVAPPAESRGSSKWEYVFVNGRYVRDRFVSHAIKEAYRSLIDPSRYPVVFMFITVEPELVDVNVHPTKVEVRWRDSNYVHGQVLAALRDKFLASNLDHELRTPREDEAYRERVRDAMVDFFRREGRGNVGTEGRREEGTQAHRHKGTEARRHEGVARPEVAGTREMRSADEDQSSIERPALIPQSLNPSIPVAESATIPAMQIHDSFLVVETDEGLMIIDQHALHERILYEELRARMTEKPLESQRLLMPDVLSVPADRLEALETHADTLSRLGVELSQAGPQSVALQAFPTLLFERVTREEFVRDLLDMLAEQGTRPKTETLVHDILDMMACKAAVKAGDPLTRDEIAALLERRTLAERSSHCPHGRPTTLHMTLKDLERQFHRR